VSKLIPDQIMHLLQLSPDYAGFYFLCKQKFVSRETLLQKECLIFGISCLEKRNLRKGFKILKYFHCFV